MGSKNLSYLNPVAAFVYKATKQRKLEKEHQNTEIVTEFLGFCFKEFVMELEWKWMKNDGRNL